MKILVVEDDRLTSKMLARYLGEMGHEVVTALDGSTAWETFRQDPVRLVLTDWEMPGMSGFDLMQAIRSAPGGEYVYILFLTSRDGRSDLVRALSGGADDFVRKPFDREELEVRVRVGERIVHLQERLEEQSCVDPLTGLLNRRGLNNRLATHPEAEGDDPQAVVIADLDHFKHVNDEYGHDVGDIVLEEVARRLTESFRRSDAVSRHGGEEFLVVLHGLTEEEALAVTERAREAIEASPIERPDGPPIPVTASFGVSWAPATAQRDLAEATKLADKALYASKEAGRNRVTLRRAE